MDRAKLEQARQYAQTGGGAGCILRGGRLVLAWGDMEERFDIYSSTKSIGVMALGLALMDGKVQLQDRAKKHLPSVGTPPQSNAESGWLEELPICASVTRRGPYPHSVCLPRVTFSDLILDKDIHGPEYASGDQWAGTWADDGHLYMGWGDGTGFGHRGTWRDPATAFIGLARTDMLLARIPLNDLLNRRAVEFFAGTPDHPSWTSDINKANPVFADPQGVNAHVSCTYNKALDRRTCNIKVEWSVCIHALGQELPAR